MKKFIPLLLAVFAVTLASCEKDPDMDKLDNNYLVYTCLLYTSDAADE